MNEELPPFEERAEAVLAATFGGFHNVPGKIKRTPAPYPFWEVNIFQSLATYDFSGLTALVLAAHKYCVRVDVSAGGPRRLKIMLHPRHSRDGSMTQRHPTIQQALEQFKSLA